MNIALLTGEVTGEYSPVTTENNKYYKITIKVEDNSFISYYTVTFFNKLCEKALKEIKVGDNIFVEGKINKKIFTKKSGDKDCNVEVLCNAFEILKKQDYNQNNVDALPEYNYDDMDLPF